MNTTITMLSFEVFVTDVPQMYYYVSLAPLHHDQLYRWLKLQLHATAISRHLETARITCNKKLQTTS